MGRAGRAEKASSAEASQTRLALIYAAERLFAEQGLQRTSLRQINIEAGQRNESAIHYHFGSREAVILAILELRTRPINEVRLQMLSEARTKAGDAPLSSAALAEVMVMPLAQSISVGAQANYYIRFLTQLSLDRAMRQRVSDGPHDTAVVQCVKELARSKPYYPIPVVRQRFVAASFVMNRMLAILEEIMQTQRERSAATLDSELRIANVIDMMVGIFDAPVSPSAICALEAINRKRDSAKS
ncbi:TetR family transcriptional regulator [Afipia sp. P52-10]|uniref:helix-turn-helix domain-containing protein n=1 Tax=Afipia sp. P52-10 TaxID=1429916 RepID=UPI0003DF0A4E|nr:helix-turn-helix domain-containing protein [Afipia sp. P52-10]ETR78718.1 TetR family transcriptional regulator [Afipia sp. P52-10]